jgi:hypothetical protein
MNVDNGGPAFPLDLTVEGDHRWGYGMMLRDYFAAKVLQGADPFDSPTAAEKAQYCYSVADAMIEARKVKS